MFKNNFGKRTLNKGGNAVAFFSVFVFVGIPLSPDACLKTFFLSGVCFAKKFGSELLVFGLCVRSVFFGVTFPMVLRYCVRFSRQLTETIVVFLGACSRERTFGFWCLSSGDVFLVLFLPRFFFALLCGLVLPNAVRKIVFWSGWVFWFVSSALSFRRCRCVRSPLPLVSGGPTWVGGWVGPRFVSFVAGPAAGAAP